MKTLLCATALAAALVALPAIAEDRTEAGLLECEIDGGVGFVIGSSKEMSCVYSPADKSRPQEAYVGTVSKFGLDVGVTDKSVMQWLVLAPSADPFPDGALAGHYIGASAEASAAIGGGANVLVGGSNDTVSLQPVSVQGQVGLNLALGVTDFRLAPAG
jgi:hypothetical protein